MTFPSRLSIFIACAAVTWTGRASAAIDDNTKSASRELSKAAKHDFDRGDFDQASHKFQKAFSATEVPTLALWSARALVKQGRLVAAAEFYRKACILQKNELWIGEAQPRAQEQAQIELQQLTPRIAQLTIVVNGATVEEVELFVDGISLPGALLGVGVPIDPGQRVVTIKRGADVVQEQVALAEGEQRQITLTLSSQLAAGGVPPRSSNATLGASRATLKRSSAHEVAGIERRSMTSADQRPTSQRTETGRGQRMLGWIGLGVGGMGVVVGVAAGLIVKSRYSDYKPFCPTKGCDLDEVSQSKLDDYNLWRGVATTGFVVGAVGTAAGITLLLTSPKSSPNTRIGVWVSPSAAELRGSF